VQQKSEFGGRWLDRSDSQEHAMVDPISVKALDLTPIPGKRYFNTAREWREEFIYFLLIDRFQDSVVRPIASGPARRPGVPAGDVFYGGTLNGIRRNLDYIAGLGCTAIWLSPVFENNGQAYHGYDINNYLQIDPRFGTKQDLIDLVDAAHGYVKNGEPSPPDHPGCRHQSFRRQLVLSGQCAVLLRQRSAVRLWRLPPPRSAHSDRAAQSGLVSPPRRDPRLRSIPGKPTRRHLRAQRLRQRR
jgi:hypothetical protein